MTRPTRADLWQQAKVAGGGATEVHLRYTQLLAAWFDEADRLKPGVASTWDHADYTHHQERT